MRKSTFSEAEVNELDRRRQAQIANQVEIINRLFDGEATYDSEMAEAQRLLAVAQVDLEIANRRIAELERMNPDVR